MAVAYELPPSSQAPSPSLQHCWREGRLWVGAFKVPDRPFLLHAPCPCCGGPVYHDDGDFRCMLCARDVVIVGISGAGRVVALVPRERGATALVRVAPKQSRETYRALSRLDGTTGLQARVLRLLPSSADQYAVVETLATTLSIRREHVRTALEQLETQGLVARFSFAAGYRTGWRRVRAERMA